MKSLQVICESARIFKVDQLPKEDAFKMKRQLGKKDQSARYCCEAVGTLSAEHLPSEDAY